MKMEIPAIAMLVHQSASSTSITSTTSRWIEFECCLGCSGWLVGSREGQRFTKNTLGGSATTGAAVFGRTAGFKLGEMIGFDEYCFSDGLKRFNHQLENEELFLEWGMIFDVQHFCW